MNLGFPENKKARVWFYLILPALLNLSLFFIHFSSALVSRRGLWDIGPERVINGYFLA